MCHFNILFLLLGILIYVLHISAEGISHPPQHQNSTQGRLSRILNGEISDERKYRYHVSIMRIIKDQPILICGGSIIHRRYVLTAAHCVEKQKSGDLVVRIGGINGPPLSQPQDEKRRFHKVVKIMIPRQYSSLPCRQHQHDIAILKVQNCFDLTDFERYQKVNLPEADSDFEGYVGRVAGYGPDYNKEKTIQPDGIKNYYLQYVRELRSLPLTVISNEECQDKATVVITESTICARTLDEEAQTCFEDDGGPLVYDGTIIGILNNRNCDKKVPEMFTRVSSYLHFINAVLNHESSADIIVR